MRHFFPIVLLFTLASAAIPQRPPQKAPRTMMAVLAHADDEVFVAPLLAHYARQGVKVYLVIMTNGTGPGRLGISPGIPNGPEVARVRAEEARCSSRELGIEPPVILEFEELGRVAKPPWDYLARAERELRRLFAETRRRFLSPSGQTEPTAIPTTVWRAMWLHRSYRAGLKERLTSSFILVFPRIGLPPGMGRNRSQQRNLHI